MIRLRCTPASTTAAASRPVHGKSTESLLTSPSPKRHRLERSAGRPSASFLQGKQVPRVPAVRCNRLGSSGPTRTRRGHLAVSCSADTRAASTSAAELRTLVNGGGGAAGDREGRVRELVAELAAARAPVQPAALAGPWQVAWSEGTMAWRALVAQALQAVAGRCRAGQAFDLGASSALNFAELFDSACLITARGTFAPATDTQALPSNYPIAFDVEIEEGDIRAFNRRFKLPISGPGYFEVLYGDDTLRIFKSSGGIAIQVPSDWQPPSE